MYFDKSLPEGYKSGCLLALTSDTVMFIGGEYKDESTEEYTKSRATYYLNQVDDSDRYF